MIFALAGLSMPAFWLGLLLIYVFAVDLRLVSGARFDVTERAGAALGHAWRDRLGGHRPAGALDMIDVLNEDYIRTARAKGLVETRVVLRHALRNALIPIVTIIGLQFGGLLSGAFIVEVIFAWHGIGELAIIALQHRDFPLIQGIVLVVATTYVLVNLAVDLVYALLDRRIIYS